MDCLTEIGLSYQHSAFGHIFNCKSNYQNMKTFIYDKFIVPC